ncbi:DUF2207 domain-containing protein [Sphingomonas sp. KRR8]|uniref:DUF2207 domain-containing protein n=1 Tax=Sphingomonas sp. KRR8 TaxID=2942996 RepID=UPI0020200B76|nr:DUF2207 domain-containing protein [Sphingomonas sp. KRR8]URD61633.1 DUF2207 domain-containing protein [Sphingomonas sp. KRR8]
MSRLAAALLALLALVPVRAAAEERIRSYDSRILIQKDGALDVTETLDVTVENQRINHGIFRDFPTRYRAPHGGLVKVGFSLIGTTRDGEPEPSSTQSIGNGIRVRIGDPERIVPQGEHRYTIHYRATRELGFFDKYDELYWNVTGNGWIFPIDQASATVILPAPATFGQRAFYTGSQGSADHNATVTAERPGEIRIEATAPLDAYQGLTIALAFPKGVVSPPSRTLKAGYWLADYGPPLTGAAVLVALLGFFWRAWRRVGRDPAAGPVVPLFSPPPDLSPAAMRYLETMTCDNRAFAAALVDLGVRGHVRLTEEDGGWFAKDTTRIDRLQGTAPLPDEEAAMLDALIAMPDQSLEMKQENHSKFSAASKALEMPLKERFDGKLFKRNLDWAIIGLALVLGGMWLTATAMGLAAGVAGGWLMMGLGALAATLFLLFLRQGARGGMRTLWTILAGIAGVVVLFVSLPIALAGVEMTGPLPLLGPLLAVPLALSAFKWLSAPTAEGRKTLDAIAGFKQYLSIAEQDRLERMTGGPAQTVELFERYLPYAIALKVENKWADRFRSTLAAAAAAPGQQQSFLWYSGSHQPWDNPGGFVRDVGSSLSSAISSASTAPGSSSGSGGGGFSGGGGGGGGGGGW